MLSNTYPYKHYIYTCTCAHAHVPAHTHANYHRAVAAAATLQSGDIVIATPLLTQAHTLILSSQTHSPALGCPAPCLKGLPIIFVCFCFVLFPSLPLYSVLWETPKDYSQPPRKTARTGRSGHLGLLTPQLALVGGGREGLLIYLFIYPSCPAPHPSSCPSPLGKMKNSLRQQQTRQTTWPPQFNFL